MKENGDNDVSLRPSQLPVLLFRGLAMNINEEVFAKGAEKLLKVDDTQQPEEENAQLSKIVSTSIIAHAGARPGSIRRILLVCDCQSEKPWGYGFVEFATLEVKAFPIPVRV